MNRFLAKCFCVVLMLCFVQRVIGDCYMHTPRGSNNRLNTDGENASNEDRLFDSQNNAKGGYNVGVGNAKGAITDTSGAMHYYEGTTLWIEWTNQHACGDFVKGAQNHPTDGSKIRECEILLQYACESDKNTGFYWSVTPEGLRNGFTEDTPPKGKIDPYTGQHEPMMYYHNCETRQRNKGLFSADQRLQGDAAKYTRQNPNGNRRGYECPEERDYYPYWHPTPWRDAAVLTNNIGRCDMYKRETQNVKSKGWCSNPTYNTKEACESVEGLTSEEYNLLSMRAGYTNKVGWHLVMMERLQRMQKIGETAPPNFNASSWDEIAKYVNGADGTGLKAVDYMLKDLTAGRGLGNSGRWSSDGSWGIDPPACEYTNWTRSNHLGNARGIYAGPYAMVYPWKIPKSIIAMNGNKPTKCVFRIRYNMSSADYDNWNTQSWGNFDYNVIKHNPVVQGLQLTINTNQVGRTFQDRSHVFFVEPTPTAASFSDGYTTTIPTGATIHNLNVRGKRGNIVQAYPAVEYDFVPNHLEIKEGDFVHFQWTGSNNNPRNYAGQGTAGTDRSNVMQVGTLEDNIPLPMEKTTMWGPIADIKAGKERDHALYLYLRFALLNQTNPLLNDAAPYFNEPPVQFKSAGTYHFLCSRNNNFSNRSQKGTIKVNKATP